MVEPRPQRWVLTGPVGAGKSRVAELLRELGACIVDADAVGHRVLREPETLAELVRRFGPEILLDGAIDRRALARRVFDDPADLARLNAVTHPRLAAALAAELDACADRPDFRGLAVLEAAVYFQLPPLGDFDLVLTVTAPAATRRGRLIASGRLGPEEADARIAAQQPLLADFEQADVILHNDGDAGSLADAVRRLYAERFAAPPPEDP